MFSSDVTIYPIFLSPRSFSLTASQICLCNCNLKMQALTLSNNFHLYWLSHHLLFQACRHALELFIIRRDIHLQLVYENYREGNNALSKVYSMIVLNTTVEMTSCHA